MDEPFAYVGRRTTGNGLQRTLVHGPGWDSAGIPSPDLYVSIVNAALAHNPVHPGKRLAWHP